MLLNSMIYTPISRFMTMDMNHYYLGTLFEDPKIPNISTSVFMWYHNKSSTSIVLWTSYAMDTCIFSASNTFMVWLKQVLFTKKTSKIPCTTWLRPVPFDSRPIVAQHTSHHLKPRRQQLWCQIHWKRARQPFTPHHDLPLWKIWTRLGRWINLWPQLWLEL